MARFKIQLYSVLIHFPLFWKTSTALCQGLSNTVHSKIHSTGMHHGHLVMTKTTPILMTHTVLPIMRFLMTFIQINNTFFKFARIKIIGFRGRSPKCYWCKGCVWKMSTRCLQTCTSSCILVSSPVSLVKTAVTQTYAFTSRELDSQSNHHTEQCNTCRGANISIVNLA